jgi:hypothetical protein
MLENHERSESLECMTEPEILSAIRYLDPDLEPKRTRQDAGKVCGICITWLTMLTGVVTYICLYFWRL